MLFILILMTCAFVLAAAIHWVAAIVTLRSGTFFGVTVTGEFGLTPDARRILWHYRWSVVVTTLVCIATMWFVVPRLAGLAAPLTASGFVFLWCGVVFVIWFIENKKVRPFAKPQAAQGTTTRTASLTPRPQTPGGRLTFAGPMLIVVAMHFLLWTRQYTLPPETYRAALALLVMAYVASALFMWMGWLILFRTRHIYSSGSISEQENADKRFGYLLRLMFAYEFTAFMVALFLPAARIAPAGAAPWLTVSAIVMMALIMPAAVLILIRKRRRSPLGIPEQGNGNNIAAGCWKYGFIYYNPDDPSFVVGTRLGPYGCDFNFANKWSWVASFGLVGVPILIRLVWF
jgi:uncharacterized membrane protein